VSALSPGIYDPNVFLRIGADNTVTLLSKHSEMGQGITTGLATLVAEELEADWSQLRVAFAPYDPELYANLAFKQMATGGSSSLSNSWEQMREVGAAARTMLVNVAASRWNARVDEIVVARGVVSDRGSKRIFTFGELAADAMKMPVPKNIVLKDPKLWKLIGKRLPRLDSVAKTTGAAQYASDVRRPGELVAMVRRPDQFGAKVLSVDDRYSRSIPGVIDIVQVPSGIAVLATDTWSAMAGRNLLTISWDTSTAELRSTHQILDDYRRLAQEEPSFEAVRRGDAAAALARATHVLEVEFTFPYLAHAPLEPINAVMQLRPGGAEIWSGCQTHSADATFAANVLGLAPNEVKINTLLGGGSFGRRGDPEGNWSIELAEIAKAIGGRSPVHLIWTREDDIKGGYYRPLTLHKVKVGLDAIGQIAGWQHKVVCQSRVVDASRDPEVDQDVFDRRSVAGLADTPYDIPDFSVEFYNARSPVPVHPWRSVAHSHTAHAIETALDELARRSGKDPIQFRHNLLTDHPRDLAVLKLAAEKASWGAPIGRRRGRGIAYHRSFNTRVAMVAEVSISLTSYRVDRIVCAVDCGVAVNPDVIEAQIEGAVGFALSSILRNAITLKNGVVEQSNFDDYEPTRLSEMPKVEVYIVKSLAAPSGIGEPGVPPLAPAIGNAIAAATGKRLYSLPFDMKLLR
jgi:isoquinoline 1-oxidoreductase beta subunit